MPPTPPKRYRFDVYEFVAATGELYRKEYRLRLSEQSARLLLALLERQGDVLTREELRVSLWPNGEHLDYDHAIRNGINQLRAVFRDKPQQPKFIETLPKRGYRFVAEVRIVSASNAQTETVGPQPQEAAATNVLAVASPTAIVPQVELSRETIVAPSPRRFIRRFRLPLAAVLLLVVLTAFLGFRALHRSAPTAHPSPGVITLGIAPIETLGPAAQQLAEPFRLELMDAASQLPGVEVRATHSFPEASGMGNLRGLAQKLQLDALLIGRIDSVDANHFNFVFELVRGSDAVYLASFHYSGTSDQLGTARDQIQRALFFRLSSVASQRLKPVRSTENPTAYSDYLSGRAQLIRHDDAAIRQAVEDFRHAVELDPAFAQAYAGLGSAYLLQAEHASSGREASYESARSSSEKAISLNPNLGEAHATLGFLDFRHDWNARASEAEFAKAIELDPNQAMHRIMYALLLCNTLRSDEALEQISRAHAADPLWPPIYITEMYVASAAHKNDRALDAAKKLLELMPNWPLAHDQSAWAFWYAGRYEDAVQEWIRMAELDQDQLRLTLERRGLKTLKQQGTAAYSQLKLDAIEHSGTWNHPNDFQPAEWQINAGKDTQAIASLTEMVRTHDPESLQFAASPAYQRLHGNPAFRALLTQIGLPQP